MRMIVAALLLYLSAAPAASSVSGRVTEAGSNRPLPRILVTLVGADDKPLAETLTDDDGRYRFAAVAAGQYAVSAEPGEHRAEHLRQWFGEKDPASRWGRPPRYSLTVADGQDLTGIDIAMVVALGIEGRIVAPWEEGLANVPVVAIHADGRLASDNPVYSDDLGNYRLYRLAPGRYRVCANPVERVNDDEGRTAPFVKTCHPSSTSEATAGDITLTSRDVMGIDVRVQRTSGRTVSGTVVDAAGRPADGATVTAISLAEVNRSGSATVRDGAFSIAGLLPGVYALQGHIGRHQRDENPDEREGESGFLQVDLNAVDATGVPLVLSRAVTVRGRLTFDGRRPSPALVSRLLVRAFPVVPLFLVDQTPAPVLSDASFQLPDVFPRPLLLAVDGLPDDWAVKKVQINDRDVTHTPTNLADGGPIEITITNRLARPVVRVRDADGRPVTDARVLVMPATLQAISPLFGARDWRPSADGDIKIGPLAAGDYRLIALTRDEVNLLYYDRSRFSSLSQVGTIVTLREDESPSIELRLSHLPEKR